MAVGMGVRHSLLFVLVPSAICVTSCLEAYSPPCSYVFRFRQLVVWWDSEPGYDPLNPPKADWSVPHSTERQFMVHPLTGEQVEIGDEKNLREIARTHTEVFIPPAVYSGSKDGLVVVPPKQVYEQMMAKEAADEAAAAAAAAALSAEAQRVSLAASQDAHKGKGAFGGGQEGVFEHEQTPPVQDGVQASLATGGSGGNAGGTALEQQGVQHHSQQHEPRASPDLHSASAHNTQASKVMALRAAHAEAQQAHAMAPPSAAATAAAANIQ
jgi:hypothetical protein